MGTKGGVMFQVRQRLFNLAARALRAIAEPAITLFLSLISAAISLAVFALLFWVFYQLSPEKAVRLVLPLLVIFEIWWSEVIHPDLFDQLLRPVWRVYVRMGWGS